MFKWAYTDLHVYNITAKLILRINLLFPNYTASHRKLRANLFVNSNPISNEKKPGKTPNHLSLHFQPMKLPNRPAISTKLNYLLQTGFPAYSNMENVVQNLTVEKLRTKKVPELRVIGWSSQVRWGAEASAPVGNIGTIAG